MGDRLVWARKRAKFKSTRAAAIKHGWIEVTYRSHESGLREYDLDAAQKYGRAFKVDPVWLLHGIGEPHRKGIPIVGYVGAGGAVAYDTQLESDPDNTVPAPPDAPPDTVTVIIRGDSLGPYFDGWLAFYARRQDPVTDDLLGNLCVVGTTDGRTLIKWLRHGRRGFNLISGNGSIEENVRLEWGAKVIDIRQR